jgi:shikimate kinase
VARLVLIGLPGVGKSVVARAVAERWACPVVDTDDLVAAAVGRAAGVYLRDAGEPEFRRRELDALREALGSDAVVATGGGVVATPDGRQELRAAVTVWLDAPDEVIVSRLDDVERPLLGADAPTALASLRRERQPWYEEVARLRVDATGSPDEVASAVIEAVARVSP